MIPKIYDVPEENGMNLMFDMENGMGMILFLTDESAEELVNMIQNKLNGRYRR